MWMKWLNMEFFFEKLKGVVVWLLGFVFILMLVYWFDVLFYCSVLSIVSDIVVMFVLMDGFGMGVNSGE